MFSLGIHSSRRNLVLPFFGLIVTTLLFSTAPSFFAQINNRRQLCDLSVGKQAANGTPPPIYRPELGRTFRVELRWTWAQERK